MSLADLQKRMAAVVMNPLTSADGIAAKTRDGKSTRAEAAAMIKPNDRLTSLDRLEIYNKQYWFRVLDSMFEDFPGLCAVLGPRAFEKLIKAYLVDCPSRSFTQRNLGSQLEGWLRQNPGFAGKWLDLALDMVRLEWAHIEAFDNPTLKILGPEDLLELGPNLRLGLQPYITVLDLSYPVDDLRIRVNADSDEHASASNAIEEQRPRRIVKAAAIKAERTYVAIHRVEFTVFYRRMNSEEFRLLQALGNGATVGDAIDRAFAESSASQAQMRVLLETWFAMWSELGWLCQSNAQTPKSKRKR